jgi:hypothetical protein
MESPKQREDIIYRNLETLGKEYKTPSKKEMPSLDSFMIDKTIHERKFINVSLERKLEKYKDIEDNYIVIYNNFSSPIKFVVPTINTHCHNLHYHKIYNRYLTIKELFSLQGFKGLQQLHKTLTKITKD